MTTAYWRAVWVGTATQEANGVAEFPFKDSEAARWRADASKRAKAAKKSGMRQVRRRAKNPRRNVSDRNGHEPTEQRIGTKCIWRCKTCKLWACSIPRLAKHRCLGEPGQKWLARSGCSVATRRTEGDDQGAAADEGERRHDALRSGEVLWCQVCGCFAHAKAVGLLNSCKGPPPPEMGSGGRRAQLTRLRAGRHLVTCEPLPNATRPDGTDLKGVGTYARLEKRNGSSTVVAGNGGEGSSLSGFSPYVPVDGVGAQVVVGNGRAASDKMRLRLGRVRCCEAARKRQARKALAVVKQTAADYLIASFVDEQVEVPCSVDDDRSDEEFWSTLDDRDWNTPASHQPVDAHCGRYVPAGFKKGGVQTRGARLQAMGLRR